MVLGVTVLRARLDYQLASAGLAVTNEHRARLYLLDERGHPDEALAAAAASRTSFPSAPAERLAAYRSLPRWLAARLLDERDDADALLAACNQAGPVTVRANLLKTTRESLLARLREDGISSEATPLSPLGLHLQGRPNIRGSAAWREGLFEVQDEGSQLLALATKAAPGETVLDLCAGRGGKALALAALVGERGRVVAFDVDEARLQDLAPRAKRAGATIEVRRREELAPADAVLVDAPCSELGTLRRSPDLRWRLRPEELESLPALQLSILADGAALTRPGGRLVYATCTLLRAENAGVVEAFRRRHPDFALDEERELLPHAHGTDGFYFARLRRRG